jgi:hypothetical protein
LDLDSLLLYRLPFRHPGNWVSRFSLGLGVWGPRMGRILTYLAFNEVSDASLSHDGDGHGFHDLLDHAGVGHARDATLNADISGDTLEGHYGGGTGFFSNAGLIENLLVFCAGMNQFSREQSYLLCVHDVHDNATLQHLGETRLDGEVIASSTIWGSHCELCKNLRKEESKEI